MHTNYFGGGDLWFGTWLINMPFWLPPFFLLLALWSITWKGLGLWHAGRRGDTGWFVALLVLNTLGILEIIYLFAIAKMKSNQLFSKHQHHGHHTHH